MESPRLEGSSPGLCSTVLVDNQNNPEHPPSSTQSVTLYFESASSQDYDGNSGTLVICNETYQGHILLIIEAGVSELYASKDVSAGLVLATLDAQKLTYEKQYSKTWRTAVLAPCINSVRFRRSPHGSRCS
jgi:hypothetical protein